MPSCRVQPAPTQGFPARDWHSWVLIPHSITTPWGGRQQGGARVGSYGLGCLTPAGVWKGKEVPESMRTPPLWGHPALSTKWRGRATNLPGQALSCACPHLAVSPPYCPGVVGPRGTQLPSTQPPVLPHLSSISAGVPEAAARPAASASSWAPLHAPFCPHPLPGCPGQAGARGDLEGAQRGAGCREPAVQGAAKSPGGGSRCSPAPCSHAPPAVMLSAMRDLGL